MKRILVSGIVVAVCLAGQHIQLPGVAPTPEWSQARTPLSIMALGIMPLLTGYLLVEFAALLVPAWRRLRVGPPEGRARLHRASLIVGTLLSVFQAVVLVKASESQGWIVPLDGVSRMVTGLTLVGAVVAQAAMARVVDREGLGNGFAILLLSTYGQWIWDSLRYAFRIGEAQLGPSWTLPAGMVVTAAAAGAVLWMFGSGRGPAAHSSPRSLLSRPACGLIALPTVVFFFKMVAVSVTLRPGQFRDTPPDLMRDYWFVAAPLGAGLAILFTNLFHRPARVAELWRRLAPNPPEGVPHPRSAYVECAVFIAALTVLSIWAGHVMGAAAPSVMAVALVTGIVCDLIREWQARRAHPELVSVWEIHQPDAVPPVLRCLAAEGIPAVAQGERFRALLQFFGPYTPIHLLVPTEHAPRAHAVLRQRWPDAGAEVTPDR